MENDTRLRKLVMSSADKTAIVLEISDGETNLYIVTVRHNLYVTTIAIFVAVSVISQHFYTHILTRSITIASG